MLRKSRNTRMGCVITSQSKNFPLERTVMQDVMSMLNSLCRPRLLIRAARIGAQDYVRERHLKRVLKVDHLPRSGVALIRLLEIERALNEQRCSDDTGYSLVRHMDVLIALLGEAKLFSLARPTLVPVD